MGLLELGVMATPSASPFAATLGSEPGTSPVNDRAPPSVTMFVAEGDLAGGHASCALPPQDGPNVAAHSIAAHRLLLPARSATIMGRRYSISNVPMTSLVESVTEFNVEDHDSDDEGIRRGDKVFG